MLVRSTCISTIFAALITTSIPSHGSSIPGAAADPAKYVDAFIGTTNGGNVFPGATLPYGSAKAGADAIGNDGKAGSVSDGSRISGISQLHDDGTGGGSSLGNFKILPMYCDISGHGKKCVTNETTRALSHGPTSASPGYFSILLNSSISVEMTVTAHATLHHITYHDVFAPGTRALLVDLTNDGMHSFSNGSIQVEQLPFQSHHHRSVDETMAGPVNAMAQELYKKPQFNGVRVTGRGNFRPSFGQGNYNVYFCLDAPGITAAATYTNDKITSATSIEPPSGSNAGALLQLPSSLLPSTSLYLRVGVSFLSTTQACTYAQDELPDLSQRGFSTIKETARAKWNDVLGTVEVDPFGVAHAVIERFWSSLYRTYIAPVNVTGDNPLWDSTEPYYDSFYCIWDSFRVVHPLFAITQPTPQSEMVRSLVDIYLHLGWLPDCRMSLSKGYTQGGSNADTLITDSYVKGVQGVDWATAFEAVVKDATVQPPDWNLNGRNGLKSRAALHYVPKDDTTDPTSGGSPDFSASHTLEYAYNDFSISVLAKGLGKQDEYAQYLNASRDWENIWDASVEDTGFKGFIQARYTNGSFAYVDPRHCSPVLGHEECYGGAPDQDFYEASAWEYSFYAPHDMARLVALMRGAQTFVRRLDAAWDNTFIDIYDEPAFLPAYLYNYAGAPAKTVDRVLVLLDQYFNTTANGIPGNDDSGAMGAFVVWSSFGLFPVAGQPVYLLSAPLFPSISITNPDTGAAAHIVARGFDGARRNKYVQSVTLDGKPYTKNWIDHGLFAQGGTLEFVLGLKPSEWGTHDADLPPSVSTSGY